MLAIEIGSALELGYESIGLKFRPGRGVEMIRAVRSVHPTTALVDRLRRPLPAEPARHVLPARRLSAARDRAAAGARRPGGTRHAARRGPHPDRSSIKAFAASRTCRANGLGTGQLPASADRSTACRRGITPALGHRRSLRAERGATAAQPGVVTTKLGLLAAQALAASPNFVGTIPMSAEAEPFGHFNRRLIRSARPLTISSGPACRAARR